jgi:hypothetical protein
LNPFGFFVLLCLLISAAFPAMAQQEPAEPVLFGGDSNFAPFEYLDEKGEAAGFDIDILRAVAEVAGLKIEIRLGHWEEMRRRLEDERIYYRGVVSSKIFNGLDMHLWRLTFKWATRSHPKKPRKWVARRYFGRFNKFRNDRWVFGDPGHDAAGGGAYHLVNPGYSRG